MLHALVTAASDVAGEEPSKTAFYVLGGVLALWAVVVSAIGISRHDDFPSSDGAARGVMGISVVLVLAAMASAVITA
jgi:hypothetical protein